MDPTDAAWMAACRFFLRAASEPAAGIDAEAASALERGELHWQRLADYLCGSGLARPLMGVLNDPALARSVPGSFVETLSRRGVFDVVRERAQREALAQIGDALRELRGYGVLLKGSAFLTRASIPEVSRGTSDVDIYVEPTLAPRLRSHLLACGFGGPEKARPSAFHHLEPIAYQGVAVEIHTRIMPGFWGLPEREMLSEVCHVAGSDVLATLSPPALVLHSMVHLSASFFSFGLKTAWDLAAAVRAEPAFDWSRLASWGSALRVPRAFWVPMRVITEGLDLPVPSTLLKRASTDSGAQRIEEIARRRIFSATEGLFDLDVVTKTWFMLLLLDTWSGRAGYLAANLKLRGSRPGTWPAAVLRAWRADALRQPWRQYSRYRR